MIGALILMCKDCEIVSSILFGELDFIGAL